MCKIVNTRFLRPYGVITEVTTKSPQKLYNGSSFSPHFTQKSSFYTLKSLWPQVLKTRFHLRKHCDTLRGGFYHSFALQASLTSLTCPGTLALLDHHFLDHSYVSPEHTLTHMDLVLYKALEEGAGADDKEAGLVGLQRWKRQISSRLNGGGGGGIQGLKGDQQVILKDVMETINNKDKPNKMKLNKTCESVSFSLAVYFLLKQGLPPFQSLESCCWTQLEKVLSKSCFNTSPFYSQQQTQSVLKRWEAFVAPLEKIKEVEVAASWKKNFKPSACMKMCMYRVFEWFG